MPIAAIADYELPTDVAVKARADWPLVPSRAALLVHDMQEYFLRAFSRGGSPHKEFVANVEALVTTFRRRGVPVLFSVQPGRQSREERGLLWDVWGAGLDEVPELARLGIDVEPPRPEDTIIKRRYSAFFETPLAERLRERGRDQLVITGIYAHIGCLATAVDGFMQGIQPFFVGDATGDFSRADHDVALRQVARTCGVVTWTDEVLANVGRSVEASGILATAG